MQLFRVFCLLLFLLPLLGQAQRPASSAAGQPAPAQLTPTGPRPTAATPPKVKGTPVKLLTAGQLVGGDFNGVKIRKLLGNVSFQQEDTFLYCDSAYQYLDRNQVEAFSNVRVLQNDTITITGNHGFYDGNQRTARMTGNVVMRDPRMTLTSPSLDYDLNRKTAFYTETGHLTDPKNTLDSQQGFYDTNSKVFLFKGNVHLVTPDSELNNDTLRYNTISKIAYFNGPTRIKGKQGNLYAEVGTYNTNTRVSNFQKNAKIDTPNYLLGGDRLVYDEVKLYGVANGHVSLISKKDNLTLRGDIGRYWRGLGRTKLYGGRPVVRNISQKDTLYMAADTLVSVEARPGQTTTRTVLYAYPKVQIFRGNLQGVCDSLTYDRQDSIIYLNRDPVLWQAKNQLTADSIQIRSKRGKVDEVRLYANAFAVSQDTLLNFNQTKGRNMMAYFRDNKLRRVDVLGNAESIFYALDHDTATTGMNRVLSANMRLLFVESKLNKITVLTNPDARFIPPHELKPDDERLKGFRWRATERPTRRQVLGKQFDDRPPKRKTPRKKARPAARRPGKPKPSPQKPPTRPTPPKPAPAPTAGLPVVPPAAMPTGRR
ncbi:LPS export ABC transporter periplasmic protein LptC [Hymenobacter sp. BT664]|uniref:LPS export ABC transporter periplasmic protein LptC n=1 Tax=Hymenobacter montanus TaxID=2771359 RepID=A0A927GHG0_9BACT|nr:OstA-like protein [Hymenobacter montanus]MBD2766373.1 LPS export ABC transporter periplasmic protein LptC [Hymenobacter montanus]